jgi:hypothetical protein
MKYWEQVIPAPPDFREEAQHAVERNLPAKLILLGLEAQGSPWESAGLRLVRSALLSISQPQASGKEWEIVVLFTGHRVDTANRKTPRFPQAKELMAHDAIRQAMEEQRNIAEDTLLGVSGGANGGDILFLEVCEDLGIPTEMLLTLPEDQFVKASVDSDDESWVRRFYALLRKHPNAPVLADSPELPQWLHFKRNYDIWQRNNLWLLSQALSHGAKHRTLIALWDGESGDGPGGTENMVALAKQHDAQVHILNTKDIFGLSAAHGAAPSGGGG